MSLERAAVGPAGRPLRGRRPARRRPRLVPRAVAGERLRGDRPGRRGRPPRTRARPSSRPTCRPRRPGVLRGLHSTAASSTTGSSRPAGRSWPSSTSARCSTARARADRRDARARRGRLGRHPDRRRPRVPGPRAARAALPRHQRVRRHRRARLRLGRPGGRRALAAARRDRRRAPDPVRARPDEPAAGGARGAPAPHDGLTRTAPDSAPDSHLGRHPKGLRGAGTIPRLSAARAATSLTVRTSSLVPSRSPSCAGPSSPSSLAMLAALGCVRARRPAPPPADPKVVIIVGATHGATAQLPRGRRPRRTPRRSSTPRTSSRSTARTRPGRRSRRRSAARRSSSTWATATAGRARTRTTRSTRPRTASASTRRPGTGDNNNKYYGEPYVSTLDLAPNAVVLLNHLCYASGNSEPGDAAPSVTTARKRARQLRGRASSRRARRP